MRKYLLLLLVVLLLALLGCRTDAKKNAEPVQPFLFYYRATKTSFDDENGLIRPETRDLGTKTYSDQELFRLYLQGPVTASLSSPFPKDADVISVERSGNQISLTLRQPYETMTGINSSIADVCLARTALQLEGIRKVRIRVESSGGKLLRDRLFTESDLLLFDNGEFSQSTELLLYFADQRNEFLLMEKRTVPLAQTEELPRLVVEQLLLGPQSAGMQKTLPEGTVFWDLNVENGICSVDFNSDFYRNRPTDERAEQLTILSVVNSLCELDEISQVQFYVEGRRLEQYTYLDLSAPFSPDSTAFGPVREEMNEFSADLCLPDPKTNALHTQAVRIRIRGAAAREEVLISTLLERPAMNGTVNPLSGAPAPTDIQLAGGLCVVSFKDTSFLSEDEAVRTGQIRSLIATLCSLPEINRVQITAAGELVGIGSPDESWFITYAAEEP